MLGQRLMPIAMEDAAALPDQDLIDASLAMVEESDAYVGLISYRYGQAPIDPVKNPEQLSLTELEFRRAVARKIPICMFIMHDDHLVPSQAVGALRGDKQKFEAFIQLAKGDRIHAEFNSVDDLKVKAVQSLVKLRKILERSSAPVVFPSALRANRASRAASGDASTASNDLVRPTQSEVTKNETTRRPDVAAPAPDARAEPVVSGQTSRKHTTAPFYSDQQLDVTY
jgi:hypothetical protein